MTLLLFISAIIAGLIFRKSKLCTIYILVVMYIFAAHRTIDADYNTYMIGYNSLLSGTATAYRYAGYTSFLKLFANLGLSFEAYNRIFFLMVYLLLIIAIRLLTINVNFVLALYLVYSYALDVVQMKSCIADALVMISLALAFNLITDYIEGARKRKIAWIIGALTLALAIYMHFSTLYYLIALMIYFIVRNRRNIGIKMVILAAVMTALLYSGFLVVVLRYANVLRILGDLDYMGRWVTKSTRYGYFIYVVIIGLIILSTNYNHEEMIKNKRQQEIRYFIMTSTLVLPFVFLNGQYSRIIRVYMILTYIIFADQGYSSIITGKRILNNIMCVASISILFYSDIALNYDNILGALLKYNSIFGPR